MSNAVRSSTGSVKVGGTVKCFIRCYALRVGRVLAPRLTPKLKITPCRPPTTAYSIYSQLPYIPGGILFQPLSEDAPCHGDSDQFIMEFWMTYYCNKTRCSSICIH
jgi:hypothetical protein